MNLIKAFFVLFVAVQLAQAALPTGVVFDNGFSNAYGIAAVGAQATAGLQAIGVQQVIVGTFNSADSNSKAAAAAAANATSTASAYAAAAADAAVKYAAAARATADASATASLLVASASAGDAGAAAQAYADAALNAVQKSIVAQTLVAEAAIAANAAASLGAQFQGFVNVVIALAPGAGQIFAPLLDYAGGALTPGNTYNVVAVVNSGYVVVASADLTGYANTAVTAAQAALAATASQPTSVFVTLASSAALSAQIVAQAATTVSNAAATAASDAAAAANYAQNVYNAVDASIFAAFSFAVKSSTPYTTAVFRYYSFSISSPQTGIIVFSVAGGSPQTVNVSPVVQVVTVPISSFGAVNTVLSDLTFVSVGLNPLTVSINNVKFF